MTIAAVPTNALPEKGERLIDGQLIDQLVNTVNLLVAAVNAGGGSGSFTNLSVSGNSALGDAITDLIGLYGATPVAQQASAAQAAVATGAITPVVTTAAALSSYGFTQAQADSIPVAINSIITRQALIITLVNELRLDLVTLGAIKGAA